MLGRHRLDCIFTMHTQVSAAKENVRRVRAKAHRPAAPYIRGFDDSFNMPHSRHTEVRREDIIKERSCLSLPNRKKAVSAW